MIEDLKKDAVARMGKSIDTLKDEMSKVRTGRAHTSLLDQVKVDYYGNEVPLAQAATISVSDARTLSVQPWEKGMMVAIEKAIMSSGLGLNPSSSGPVIRVPLPSLTEERRKEMIKVVRGEAEGARVAIRNIRRDVNGDLKTLLKDKDITEDDCRGAEDAIQKLTDKYIADVDQILAAKEKDLMEI